jgi:hypothetical protein
VCFRPAPSSSSSTRGNFQGPPSASDTCRCKDPAQSTGSTSSSAPASFDALPNTDIPGADLGCSGQAFCKVCGDVKAVQSACSKNGACAGFTYSASEKCGYLKSKAPAFRAGWTAYRRKP